MSTTYHSKYYAHELTKQSGYQTMDRLSMSLFDSSVDLNPHQVEAALFAFQSPLSKGVVLADEVGLGKTIEAGLVLCQYWAERKRKLLIICPASLRKQWQQELWEKFNIPSVILEAKSYNDAVRNGKENPFDHDGAIIASFHFIKNKKVDVQFIPWDLVVIDEAHKLRNVHRPSNKIGNAIKDALEGKKKILLTATPLQNTLLELFGLSLLIDEQIFGDKVAFRDQFMNHGADNEGLRTRLKGFVHRTLRSQVNEYISYTERKAITRPFRPDDHEQEFYEAVSTFLQKEDTYAVPKRQRSLTTLIIRKLLASSSCAVAETLETIKNRLEKLLVDQEEQDNELFDEFIEENEMDEEWLEDEEKASFDSEEETEKVNKTEKIKKEIEEINQFIQWAKSIKLDTKTKNLIQALKTGFDEMDKVGANRKALIFTESRRTQEYLFHFLENNGYEGKVVMFNGSNHDPKSRQIYQNWLAQHKDSGQISGSKTLDRRTANIDYFKNEAEIMIATESAAEGVNLQFCSLVINYDLPWNPQRVEQRIGRCHRYGQKHDVVVINFLNERNHADRRVYELLRDKFNLFNGLFGASDEVLGTIESGVDFEKRILQIYQQCRTEEEIETSFAELQKEMEKQISETLRKTRQDLLENFDEDVHEKFKADLHETETRLDRIGKLFWNLTKTILQKQAIFDEQHYTFQLKRSPLPGIKTGEYQLISKQKENVTGEFLYRLSHPLGEYVINLAKESATPTAEIAFDISHHPFKLSVIENLKGQSGYLILSKLTIDSFDREEHLLFSGFTDDGQTLDQEICDKLFQVEGEVLNTYDLSYNILERLIADNHQHAQSVIHRSSDQNNQYFKEEQAKLEKWAEDAVLGLEKELKDIKNQIRSVSREIHLATTIEEQESLQQKKKHLEKTQRKKRREIFDTEDEIEEKRDRIIEQLKHQMTQQTSQDQLFTIRWHVV